MVAWSNIPSEMRYEIVKEMDFRTRFRFRHVSKTDQQIVDSVPLNLPRIVLKFASDDMAKMEFYLGINRKITVDFEESEEGEAKVDVSGESIDNPVEKLVACENTALLAFHAFMNVATNPKTLLDGLEFHHDMNLSSATRFKIYQLLKTKGIRTKILCISGTTHLSLILPRCSDSYLLEIQSIDNEQDGGMVPLSMVTYTRKLKVEVEDMPLGTSFDMSHLYTPTTERTLQNFEFHCHMMKFPGSRKIQKAPSDITITGSMGGEAVYHRISFCGDLACTAANSFTRLDSGECEMRWTCAKHADPFEFWYYQQVIRQEGADLGGGLEALMQNLQFHGFSMPACYREVIFPTANDVDSVYVMIAVTAQMGQNWEQRMLAEQEAGEGSEEEVGEESGEESEGSEDDEVAEVEEALEALEVSDEE